MTRDLARLALAGALGWLGFAAASRLEAERRIARQAAAFWDDRNDRAGL